MFKPWRIGVTGPPWLWFRNYLMSRSHYVSLDYVASDLLLVLSGVLQWSVLGPLLFLIDVNDIPDTVPHSLALLFADDVQRRATKFMLQDFSSECKTRLIKLNMLPLMYWLELQDITCMFLLKCFKDPPENFNPLAYVSFITHSIRSATNQKLKVSFKRTTTTRHIYFIRVVRLWNCSPSLDLSLSYPTLKYKLKLIFSIHFTNHFNPYNTCTFHIHWPCLNCNDSVVSCN